MKVFMFVIGVFGGLGLFSAGADAQNYPWCAFYSGNMGGARNCGFSTYEQCMAAVSGNGGFCARNTQYLAGAGAPGSKQSDRTLDALPQR